MWMKSPVSGRPTSSWWLLGSTPGHRFLFYGHLPTSCTCKRPANQPIFESRSTSSKTAFAAQRHDFFDSWGTPAADSFAVACAVQLSSAQCQQQLQPQGWGGHVEFGDFCKLKSKKSAEFCLQVAPNKNAGSFVLVKKTYQKHPYIPFKTARTFTKPVGVANALWAAARMTFLGPQCAANLCIAAAEAVLEVPGKLTEFQPMELSMMLCLGFDGWLKGWRCD